MTDLVEKFRNKLYVVSQQDQLDAADEIESLRAQLSTKHLQDDWKLVPIHPTQEMEQAGFHKSQDHKALIRDIYKAMLSKSPKS